MVIISLSFELNTCPGEWHKYSETTTYKSKLTEHIILNYDSETPTTLEQKRELL